MPQLAAAGWRNRLEDQEQQRGASGHSENQHRCERNGDDEVPYQPSPARLKTMPDDRAEVDPVRRSHGTVGLMKHLVEDET
jgi:hypothetical protein